MEISIVPVGTNDASVSRYVADTLEVIKKEKGIKYELNSMGTVIESNSLDMLFKVAKKMHKAVLRGNITRVVTSIKVDDRNDKTLSIHGKIKSVENKINKY